MIELSVSNLAIFKENTKLSGDTVNSNVRQNTKFNLGLLNAYKLMFAIYLSMEKRMSNFSADWIHSTLTASNNSSQLKM